MLTNRNVHIGQHVKLLLLNSALLWYLESMYEGRLHITCCCLYCRENCLGIVAALSVSSPKRRNCCLLWSAEVAPDQRLVLFFRSSSPITSYCFPLSNSGQKQSEYFFYILVINRKDLNWICVLSLLLLCCSYHFYYFSDFS